MYISPIVDGDDEESKYEDEDGNIFHVFDEEQIWEVDVISVW